jgi:inhibitor of cysteine peptidase
MIHVGEAGQGQELTVAIGELVELALPESPSTGYRWAIQDSSGDVWTLRDDTFQSLPGGIGQGGIRRWQFEAVRPGRAAIALHYRRPWETDVAPARAFTLGLRVVPATSA